MKICTFEDIRDDFTHQLRNKRLVPIIGSGFTVGSESKFGEVPSGQGMKEHMDEQIKLKMDTVVNLDGKSFSQLSTYYNSKVSLVDRKKYIRDNFTEVSLPDNKIQFLTEVDWLYIYTLNMDDAIEKNSPYNQVVVSNREFNIETLEDYKCVIKLHGDANDYVKYADDKGQIFDFKQYAKSISSNGSLLNKLRDDFTNNNLLFIGCSLDGEFDLATMDSYASPESNAVTSKYYCTIKRPDELKRIELEDYGITHVILFNNHDDIYRQIVDASKNAKLIPVDDIEKNSNIKINHCSSHSEDYLLHGKNPYNNKNNSINIPPFFIERDVVKRIIKGIHSETIHLVSGPRVSGKSYVLLSIVKNIVNSNVYYFDSRLRLSQEALNCLLVKRDCIFVFDTHALDKEQIFSLVKFDYEKLKKQNNKVVLAINTSDKDIVSVVNSLQATNCIKGYTLDSRLTANEVRKLNLLMSKLELPTFSKTISIIDNIIEIEKTLDAKSRYSSLKPYTATKLDIAVLILLAVNEKLYTTDLSNFDVNMEGFKQLNKTEPLISSESSLYYERSIKNISQTKIILNAKYWLYGYLGSFADNKDNHPLIVDAYRHIVSTIVEQNKNRVFSESMDYIKFDVINEIFLGKSKGQLSLGKVVYEGLSDLLSNNPHYYHQRAKCYLWQSGFKKSDLEGLYEALRYAKTSQHNFKVIYDDTENEKIAISLAHVEFTIALIKARISDIHDNIDQDLWSESITAIYNSMISPYNQNDFSREISKRRYRNSLTRVIHTVPNENIEAEVLRKYQYLLTSLIANN